MEEEAPRVERLCLHHNIELFDCLDPSYNEALAAYYADADLGVLPRAYVTVLGGDRVTGYIAACDVVFQVDTGPLRFFFIPHIAVSRERVGSNDAALLVIRAFKLLEALERNGKVYAGIAAAPSNNKALTDVIKASGFEQYDDAFWILRRLRAAGT